MSNDFDQLFGSFDCRLDILGFATILGGYLGADCCVLGTSHTDGFFCLQVTLFAAHFAGCLYYRIGARFGTQLPNLLEESVFHQYIVTMYWSVTTMTTIGYGDLHPENALDMGVDTIYMLFNLALTSYILGTMTSLLVQVSDRTMKYRIAVQSFMDFAARDHLPSSILEAVLTNMELKYSTESFCQEDIISDLPKALRALIAQHRFLPTVQKVYLFKGTSVGFLHQLVMELKADYYPPGVKVIAHKESPSHFFLMASGSVALTKDGESEELMRMGKEEVIGEVGVLYSIPQPFAVCTRRLTRLLLLDRTTYESVVKANPADGEIVMQNLIQYLKEANDGNFPEWAPEIKDLVEIKDLPEEAPPTLSPESGNLPASGRADVAVSLHYIAKQGNSRLLEEQLNHGKDPNATDEKGRTPLHDAAARGFEQCPDSSRARF